MYRARKERIEGLGNWKVGSSGTDIMIQFELREELSGAERGEVPGTCPAAMGTAVWVKAHGYLAFCGQNVQVGNT